MKAIVTLTNGIVTDDSLVSVNGSTVPLKRRAEFGGRLAPRRIVETLGNMGFRTVEILPADDDTVEVVVEAI